VVIKKSEEGKKRIYRQHMVDMKLMYQEKKEPKKILYE